MVMVNIKSPFLNPVAYGATPALSREQKIVVRLRKPVVLTGQVSFPGSLMILAVSLLLVVRIGYPMTFLFAGSITPFPV
jgi:uncharacterized membrane protein YgdD (TMEM256/DUF423 family)